jgi:alpha-beta hydrolase superfamily lysophospholipase
VTTTLGVVPAILSMPAEVHKPPILLWHGFGPPASEQALRKAFPLDDVPAIKIYLGLPLFGERAPGGGTDELVRRQSADMGLLIFKPIVVGAVAELPGVIRQLRSRGCLRPGDKVGLFGFSAGGAVALLALAEHSIPVGPAVLVNPSTGLSASINAFEHATGHKYTWSPESRALAARADAARHAAEIAYARPPPALLLLDGRKDDLIARQSVEELLKALTPHYAQAGMAGRLQHQVIEGLSHNIADTPNAELQQQVAAWFNRYLGS